MKLFTLFRFITLCLMMATGVATAQNISINATGAAPDSSAMLDVQSTTQGILIPRMTLAQRGAIANPAQGLIIFQTDGNSGLWVYDTSLLGWAAVTMGDSANGIGSVLDAGNNAGGDTILNLGVLGIGTSTPNSDISLGIEKNLAMLELVDLNDTTAILLMAPDPTGGGTGGMGTTTNHDLPLFTNNLDRLTIKADGKIGIGTATPAGVLDVIDAASVSSGVGNSVIITAAGANAGIATSNALVSVVTGTDGTNRAISGASQGASLGSNIGVQGYATGSAINVGVRAEINDAASNTQNIGTFSTVSGNSPNNYGVAAVASASTGGNTYGVYGFGGSTPVGSFATGVSGWANDTNSGFNYGVYGQASNSDTANRGVVGVIVGTTTKLDAAVYGIANATGQNTAVHGRAIATNSGGVNYGVYSRAANADTNYAAYFETGAVYVGDSLIIPTSAGAGKVLTSDAAGNASWQNSGVLNNTLTGSGTADRLAYFYAADSIASYDDVFIDATNNRLGVGTASPQQKLHVVGSARVSAGFLANAGTAGTPSFRFDSDANTGIYNSATDALGITAGGTQRLNVTTTGLTINSAYTLPYADGTGGQVLTTDGSGVVSWQTAPAGDSTYITDADGNTKVQVEETANDDVIRFDVAGTERFTMTGRRIEFLNSGGSVYIGDNAGNNDGSGTLLNVAIGDRAMETVSSGSNSVAVGRFAGRNITTGFGNVNVGESAGYSSSTGSNNVNVGYNANILNVTSNSNTVVGAYANYFNTLGNNNTLLGYQAGYGGTSHTKSGNVLIGYMAGANDTNDNQLFIDNSGTSTPLIYGDFSTNALQVNGSLNINGAFTLPTADGTGGQVLTTDGAGTVSWASAGSGISGAGESGKLALWNSSSELDTSIISDDGTSVGVNASPVSYAALYSNSTTTAMTAAIRGEHTLSTASTTYGVIGVSNSTSTSNSAGVFGLTSNGATAVYGQNQNNGTGTIAVSGYNSAGGSNANYGVKGQTSSSNASAAGLYGFAFHGGNALLAQSNARVIEALAYGTRTASYNGIELSNTATSTTNAITKTGLYINSTGAWTGTGATNTGLDVTVGGATTNYAAAFKGGNVGIGTSAPEALLHLTETSGDISLLVAADPDNSNENDNPRIVLQQDGGATEGYLGLEGSSGQTLSGTTGNDLILGTTGTNRLQLFTNDQIRMTVTGSNGYVGIGTTEPEYDLHVTDSTGNGSVRIQSVDPAGDAYLNMRSASSSWTLRSDGSSGLFALQNSLDSTDYLVVDTGGTMSVNSNSTDTATELYVFRAADTYDYGPDRSNVYAFRQGSVVDSDGGSSWQPTGVDAVIKSRTTNGNFYTAAVAGYSGLDYANSSALFGSNLAATIWGALAYNDGTDFWGIYSPSAASLGSLNINSAFTLPTSDGTAGQFMRTNGSGTVTWATPTASWNRSLPDTLGIHLMTTDLVTDGNWISGDGDGEGLYVNNSGDVGIGTNSPQSGLHLHESATNQATIRLTHLATASFGLWLQSDNSQSYILNYENTPMKFGTNGADRMTISNTGLVGIGTTSPAYSLDVNGAIRSGYSGTDGQWRLYSEQGATDYEVVFNPAAAMTQTTTYTLPPDDGDANEVLSTDGSGTLTWVSPSSGTGIYGGSGSLSGNTTVTQAANTLAFTSSATNGFSVDGTTFSVDAANNYVGIGTSSPLSQLHVNNSAAASSTIRLTNSATASNGFWIQSNSSGASILNYENTSIAFGTNGSTRMTITNSGNVGIGVTSPNNAFEVSGVGIFRQTSGISRPAVTHFAISPTASVNYLESANGSTPMPIYIQGSSTTITAGSTSLGQTTALHVTNAGLVGIQNTSPTSELDVSGDVEVGSADYYYLGDPSTNGSWRIGRSGNNLVFERRETGTWVIKTSIIP